MRNVNEKGEKKGKGSKFFSINYWVLLKIRNFATELIRTNYEAKNITTIRSDGLAVSDSYGTG